LGVIIKSPSPPPLSHRARGDKIHPLPKGEGRGEGINLDILIMSSEKQKPNS